MHLPSVWECALRTIFLDMHAKEAHIHTINLLKGKKCFGSVGKCLRHFSSVHKPDVTGTKKILVWFLFMWHICSHAAGISHSGNTALSRNCNFIKILPKYKHNQHSYMTVHCLWAVTVLYYLQTDQLKKTKTKKTPGLYLIGLGLLQ